MSIQMTFLKITFNIEPQMLKMLVYCWPFGQLFIEFLRNLYVTSKAH